MPPYPMSLGLHGSGPSGNLLIKESNLSIWMGLPCTGKKNQRLDLPLRKWQITPISKRLSHWSQVSSELTLTDALTKMVRSTRLLGVGWGVPMLRSLQVVQALRCGYVEKCQTTRVLRIQKYRGVFLEVTQAL